MKRTAMPVSRARRYGWIPDLPDQRDLMFTVAPRLKLKLPTRVDLRAHCSPVENQGHLGSCTANALAGNMEYLDLAAGRPLTDFSRLFVYYNERVLTGTVTTDSGGMLRDGIKILANLGCCPEPLWPYDITRFADKPTRPCYTAAEKHLITQYRRLLTLDDMRACLAQGAPFVFGFAVYESFQTPKVAKTGVASLPKPGERMLGGHAVMAAGYDDAKKTLLVRNSWGEAWGQKGYFTLPYAYLETRGLAADFWTITKEM